MTRTAPRSRWVFMSPRDIGLFLQSARTDAAIARVRAREGARAAFEAAYAAQPDPWASGDSRYSYQRWKYQGLVSMLPAGRRFGRALDLGSGIGALSRALAPVCDDVLGLDIAQSAVDTATNLSAGFGNIRFAQGDVTHLPHAFDAGFDLVVVADTLYYLDDTSDSALKAMASRIAMLLAPGGICLLANHFFFNGERDSRLSRRIHQSFAWSPGFTVLAQHWRPFYLASILGGLSLRAPVE